MEACGKNLFLNAARKPDYTIDQDWSSYTADEHGRWDRLFAKVQMTLPGRAFPADLFCHRQF